MTLLTFPEKKQSLDVITALSSVQVNGCSGNRYWATGVVVLVEVPH